MSPLNARLAVLPRELASQVVASAIARAAWAVALVMLGVDVVLVVSTFVGSGLQQQLMLPLMALGGLIVLVLWSARVGTLIAHVVFLVVGGTLVALFAMSVLLADPSLNDSAAYIINRPAFALVLVSPAISRPSQGMAWSAVGYVVAMASLAIAAVVIGVPFAPGFGPTIAFVINAATYLTIVTIHIAHRRSMPDLRRLEAETRRAALEHEYEMRAAAVIHDTVLSDLTAIMNSTRVLDDRARKKFRADVATLSNAVWLRESKPTFDADTSDVALRNGMVALVSEFQWRGLTVDVTGNPETAVVRATEERIAAIHGAVRAVLENVINHSGVDRAELVVGVEDAHVSVMVIDQGVGFNPEEVPADRLGLRTSVVDRVERLGGSVRVWSKPGKGTSVMISMPAEISLDKNEVTGEP